MDLLGEDIQWLGAVVGAALLVVGAHNVITPEEDVKVGYTEIETQCQGIDMSVCIGFQSRTHQTFNYNDFNQPEKGSENYYRRAESELMLDAYETCERDNVTGRQWIDSSEYLNMTGEQWIETGEVSLLPCEDIPYRDIDLST